MCFVVIKQMFLLITRSSLVNESAFSFKEFKIIALGITQRSYYTHFSFALLPIFYRWLLFSMLNEDVNL